MKTIDFRNVHDVELAKMVEAGDARAQQEEARRSKAAAQVRDVLARVYCRGDRATATHWAQVPCVTDSGTIGIVDIAKGTAWDSGVRACEEMDSLGYLDTPRSHGGRAEEKVTLYYGGDGEQIQPVAIPSLPEEWKQIALPTWRGHDGKSPYKESPVPKISERIRPKQVAFGLMTVYGEQGLPRKTLFDTKSSDKPSWAYQGFEPIDPSWWPLSEETRDKIEMIAAETLEEHSKILEERVGTEPPEEEDANAKRWAHLGFKDYWNRTDSYIVQLRNLCIDRNNMIHDSHKATIIRAVEKSLGPVAKGLHWMMETKHDMHGTPYPGLHPSFRMDDIMTSVARHLTDEFMEMGRSMARDTMKKIISMAQEEWGGYVDLR